MISSYNSSQDIQVYLEGEEIEKLGREDCIEGPILVSKHPEIQGVLEVWVDDEDARRIHPGIGVIDHWNRNNLGGKLYVVLSDQYYRLLKNNGGTGTRYDPKGSVVNLSDGNRDRTGLSIKILKEDYKYNKGKRPRQTHLF